MIFRASSAGNDLRPINKFSIINFLLFLQKISDIITRTRPTIKTPVTTTTTITMTTPETTTTLHG
jgi:hypothetical protein